MPQTIQTTNRIHVSSSLLRSYSVVPLLRARSPATLEASYPDSETFKLCWEVAEASSELMGERANLDFALVLLRRVLGLPRSAALTLFALGRMVGWVGHAIEQYEADKIIRPRARYVGEPPTET